MYLALSSGGDCASIKRTRPAAVIESLETTLSWRYPVESLVSASATVL
jgi:hypothetical protein